MTLAPIDLHKPWLVLSTILLAAFSHVYPHYVLPHIKYYILTTPSTRHSFGELYAKFIALAKEAKPLEGLNNEFAKFSLKKRELSKIFKVMEQYPKIYWDPYPKKDHHLFALLDTNTDSALNTNERLNKILGQSDFSIQGWLLGYIPSILFFVMYAVILICYNWDYVMFTYHDPETSALLVDGVGGGGATGDDNNKESTASLIGTFLYVLSWLPTSILSSLSSASTSFWVLYFVLTSAFAHVLPLGSSKMDLMGGAAAARP